MIRFILNEKEIVTDAAPGMLLLDFVRYEHRLTGTKIGCREGDCGACTVLVGELVDGELNYRSMTSCLLPLGNVHGKHIVTIEGINFPDQLNPIQQAMSDCAATQCGFCTPGFVMSLAGFCLSTDVVAKSPIASIDGNICRCTGYKSIERAAQKVETLISARNGTEPALYAANNRILPDYFSGIKQKLSLLSKEDKTAKKKIEGSVAVGGGTDLYVQKHDSMVQADIRFIGDENSLRFIREENNDCVIGASVTVSDLKHSALINTIFPSFEKYAKLVSSTPIRNMATIAGNFVNASPIGDFSIFFLALDAVLKLTDGMNTREIPLRSFYKGYKQLDKKPGELIESFRFRIPDSSSSFNFEKVSKRTHLDIASVNSATLVQINNKTIESASISAGGVGPTPLYLAKTSSFLGGKKINDDTIREAIDMMKTEIAPISDARGSKEYKTLLLGQLIKAHFQPLMNPA